MDQLFWKNAESTEDHGLFYTEIDIGEEFKYSQSYEFQQNPPMAPLPTSSNNEHKCLTCGKIYKKERFLKAHLRNECGKNLFHYGDGNNAGKDVISNVRRKNEKSYKCNVCSSSYSHSDSLKAHVKREHGTTSILSCQYCSYTSKIKGNLVRHVKSKHVRLGNPRTNLNKKNNQKHLTKTHVCESCNKRYLWKNDLYIHKKFICDKDPCSRIKSTRNMKKSNNSNTKEKSNNLSAPKKSNKLSAKERHKCKNCSKIYTNIGCLDRHVRSRCGIDPRFFCDHCGYSSKRKFTLATHIKHKHESLISKSSNQEQPTKTYVCETCKKSYKWKNALNQHLRFEHGHALILFCDHCSYSSKKKGHLASHIKVRHNALKGIESKMPTKSYECNTCHKSYPSVNSLNCHRRRECGKQKNYHCKYCDYSCKRNYHLKRHVDNVHNADDSIPRHECTQCGRPYKHKCTLIFHNKYECNTNK